MRMLYIDDYMRDEETLLKELGVFCARISLYDAVNGNGFEGLEKHSDYEVRSRRFTVAEYKNFYERAQKAKVSLGTSPRSFEIGGNFALQYPILGDLSPTALVADAEDSATAITRMLKEKGLKFPLFVRSELESAAKYVGVEGCTVRSASESEVTSIVHNLRSNVRGFQTLIFKEMAQICTYPPSGQAIEYRAIGMQGQFLVFDFGGNMRDELPDPGSLGLQTFAEKAFAILAQGGADGGLFLDVAMTGEGPIVVECKNLLNGTIKTIRNFGKYLEPREST